MKNKIWLTRLQQAAAQSALAALLLIPAHAESKKPMKEPPPAQARYSISFPADTWGEAFFDVYTTTVSASELLGHFNLEGRRPLSINGVNVFSEQALKDLKVKVSSEVYKEAERFVEESSRYTKLMGPCEAEVSEYYQMEALPDDNPRKAWLKKKLEPCREASKKYFHGYKSLGSNEDLKKLGIIHRMRNEPVEPGND